jgi:hypothetical protein
MARPARICCTGLRRIEQDLAPTFGGITEMPSRTFLRWLFGFMLTSLLGYTVWASSQQAVWEWQGIALGPDRWWTLATLIDAYYGFLTFYVWVWFKERSALARLGWFIAIMSLGTMAMSTYVLLQLAKLRPDEPVSAMLLPARQP